MIIDTPVGREVGEARNHTRRTAEHKGIHRTGPGSNLPYGEKCEKNTDLEKTHASLLPDMRLDKLPLPGRTFF